MNEKKEMRKKRKENLLFICGKKTMEEKLILMFELKRVVLMDFFQIQFIPPY